MNQPNTVVQDDSIPRENTQIKPSTSKTVRSKQVAQSEFAIPNSFNFRAIREKKKRSLPRYAKSFTEYLKNTSLFSLLFSKTSPFPPIIKHFDFFLFYSLEIS